MSTIDLVLATPDYPSTAISYELQRTFVATDGVYLRGTRYSDTTDGSGSATTPVPIPDSGAAEYVLFVGTKRTQPFYPSADSSKNVATLLDLAGLSVPAASLLDARVAALEADAPYEPALGDPAADGYVLSSTAAGVRSWVAQSGGGGAGVTDGDKGDIVVSGSGAVWNLDSTVVTTAGRALLDDASAAAQRTTLGLGTAATTDSSAYDAAGTAASAVAAHEADTTNVHGIADTASLVLNSDSRLTNARTPTAHASSHAAAGSDPLTLSQSQITNLTTDLANKADDTDLLNYLLTSNFTWTNLSGKPSTFAPSAHAASHTNGTDQLADATTLASGFMSAADKTKLNGVASGATANTGTVTSVDLSVPGTLYTVNGNPVTTSGTLALSLKTQTANTVLAGPTTGAAATPTMRALVAADVPNLDAAKLTSGTIATARLGSGTASSSTYLRGDQTYATPPNTLPPLALYWSANGDIYFVAHEAMTLSTATEAGTGTLSYTKALAASPTSFSSTSLPVTLATGDVLKITCASISTYKAATLPRTA